MTVRCKFRCQGITKQLGWVDGKEAIVYAARMNAVHSGSEENKSFFAATPAGSLELQTLRADLFDPGKSYYLDITEAPE